MFPAPLPPELRAAAPAFAARLAMILAALAALVAARYRILGPHTAPLWSYINRTSRRFARLMDRLAQGRLPPPRPGMRPSGTRPAVPLPAQRAWLVRVLGYQAAGYGSQLNHLLSDPEFERILAAVPQAGRLLRPLCRQLGRSPRALAPPPPPPAVATGPAAPAEPAPAPAPAQVRRAPPCPRLRWPWLPPPAPKPA